MVSCQDNRCSSNYATTAPHSGEQPLLLCHPISFTKVCCFVFHQFLVLGGVFLMVVRMTWPLLTLFNAVLFHLCDLRKFNLVRGDSIVLVCITAVV